MNRVVFLLAHPDDEFACSVRMLRHARAGDEVHCVYLTDGGHGGQSVARREAESRRALSLLGVVQTRVHFLGSLHAFGDGRLHAHMEPAADVFEGWLRGLGDVERIYLPAWEGGHQDHDACHLIGAVVAHAVGVPGLMQYPLYHGAGLPGPWFRVLSPLAENGPVDALQARFAERWLAVRLCFAFVSQWRTWMGLLPFFVLRMALSGAFPVQPVSAQRWRFPPHAGRVLYERRGFLRYEAFARCAAEFLAARAH